VSRFARLLGGENVDPRRVLDIGSGTGLLLGNLVDLYPAARVTGMDLALGMNQAARDTLRGKADFVTGDAERLPFADGIFDLVVSTSTFQWLDSMDKAFSEIMRVLVPGGLFCFALFGEKTLYELRTSYRRAFALTAHGVENRTHTFLSAAAVEASLARQEFVATRTWSEFESEEYADVAALLRAIRRIGAGNASPVAARGLAGRRTILSMMEIYRQQYSKGGSIPATYEVVCGVGRKRGDEAQR
jgi:malonyl-CoA O-methyltransferase